MSIVQAQGNASKQPNFIVFYCDNLGYGDIEPFGSTVNRTPHLNQMAKEGRKFTHFYVTSGVCTPSRASIMTGCYAQRVGMHWNDRDGQVLRPISPYGLHPDEITIAEVLEKAGYQTGIIGKWHLGDQPGLLPTDQGFDYFYGIPYSDDMTREVGLRLGQRYEGYQWPDLPLMLNDKVLDHQVDRNLLTRDYTEKTLAYIENHADNPFFLYLPQAMPGSTKQPFSSAGFRGRSMSGPWGDSVEELDWSLGEIMSKLEELGIAEQTLLIFTSDNGSPMGKDMEGVERGTNRPLHGRGYTTAEGGFRVPCIMWWPGRVPASTVCQEMVTTMDLLPTFAQYANVSLPEGVKIDGHPINDLIDGQYGTKTPYTAFYYYDQHQLQAVRSGPWKLFVPLQEFRNHPHFDSADSVQPLLFNVVEDISSSHNLASSNPEIVQQLTILAEEARKDLGDLNRPGQNQRPPGKVSNPIPMVSK
ncbi:sulfatase family protein [Membranihabitans marinus]|uniref:sulfatase family protein n=1 Tax=Membranihabitans marinus TaxID=1227546 RepID=UPI001F1D6E81|nr:sulfatase [Membranihabitans marinus]